MRLHAYPRAMIVADMAALHARVTVHCQEATEALASLVQVRGLSVFLSAHMYRSTSFVSVYLSRALSLSLSFSLVSTVRRVLDAK